MKNGHPFRDARPEAAPGYGQVTADEVTEIGTMVAPSVMLTEDEVLNGPPAGSVAARVIVTVCPETIAFTSAWVEVAE